MSAIAEIGIGSTVWVFDPNRRVYPRAPEGKLCLSDSPIWREYWRPCTIKGENSRSWILSDGTKVPKKNHNPLMVSFSQEEIDKAAWVQENRHKIVRVIERLHDYDTLHKVAELVGYKEPPDQPLTPPAPAQGLTGA